MASRKPDYGDGASPGKIFIGGLAKDTTSEQFVKYFGKYGEITDSVIMKDRLTGRPRGFGFITYADPSVVDTVIAEVHVINNKQVEIKRTIPKGSAESKDFKTKKIFVGGIPTSVSEDEFKSFFSKYGKVVEREIIRDHVTKRSRGFGFIVFESEQAVDTILADGNLVDMDGTQVEIKKAEPKKPSNPGPAVFSSEPRKRSYDDGFNGYDNSYSNFRGGGFGPAPYRSFGTGSFGHAPYRSVGTGGFGPAPHRSFGNRFGDYNGYSGGGVSDFSGGYGDFPGGEYGSKFGDYGGYSGGGGAANRFASYGGGGYGGGYGGSGFGAYGQGSGYDGSSGPGSGAGYEAGPGGSHGEAEGPYGGRSAYSGGGRYHPYGR